jgi:peptide-methionine (S)-S-oxide reductase
MTETATFGAGCFWGVEKFFRKEFGPALVSTEVGYAGGDKSHPTYGQVCSGKTGHAEVLRVVFKKDALPYSSLVDFFFRMHDPTTANRQGNDVGTQYRSVIFYHTPEQKEVAEQVKAKVQAEHYPNEQVVTEVIPIGQYWPAEEYHQLYLDKNPGGYCNHRLRW